MLNKFNLNKSQINLLICICCKSPNNNIQICTSCCSIICLTCNTNTICSNCNNNNNKLILPSKYHIKLIGTLKIKCPNSKCNKIIKFEDSETHLKNNCYLT